MIVRTLARLYSTLLRIYPASFRAEFGEEMSEVFSQAAGEAADKSALAILKLCMTEAFGMPLSAWRAYHQSFAYRKTNTARPLQNYSLEQSWKSLLIALAVFLLPAVMLLVNQVPQQAVSVGLPAALLFLAIMIVIGWLGGIPLRSISYISIVLVIAGYLYLFQWVAGLIVPSLIDNLAAGPWDRSSYLMLEVISNGMMWLMLFCLTLLVVALLAVFNRFQPLLARVRHDWTLVSYILYGESIFVLLVLFESHRYEPHYATASLLCLVTGVWFYLRGSTHRLRLLALLGCLTLSVGIVVLEKGNFSPAQVWFSWSSLRPSEAGRLLLSWIWMVVALLLPGLLSRLPPARNHSPSPGQSQ